MRSNTMACPECVRLRGLLRDKQQLADQLQSALTTRVVIEQAKGVLSALTARSVDESFELIRGYARRRRLRMHDVAEAIVRHEPVGSGPLGDPWPCDAELDRERT
jgi:AmiR/NasT family two-component response regulator